VADEPVSSLDVSIQAQILNLLKDLQKELRLTYFFISHNLAVIRYVSDHVAVMHLGRIVESGTREAIFNHPLHPYTKLLMASVLDPHMIRAADRELVIKKRKDVSRRDACRFYGRCSEADEICRNEKEPELMPLTDDHSAACHRLNIQQEKKQ
jgi:oligopeptide/dipeptide ABC transporter ATP-binding protein